MPKVLKPGLTSRLLQSSLRAGFRRAYFHVKVNPDVYFTHLKRVHRLPVNSWRDMLHLDEHTLAPLAAKVISLSTKTAALEGMGMGLGGLLTLLPDMGILSAITVRMLQKLSLIYGFEYASEQEETDLWLAAASAAGLDLGRDFIEKQAIERIVPRIIDKIAVKCGDGSRREVVRARDSCSKCWSRRHAELLFCALVGTPRAKAFPRTPPRSSYAHRGAASFATRCSHPWPTPPALTARETSRLLPRSACFSATTGPNASSCRQSRQL